MIHGRYRGVPFNSTFFQGLCEAETRVGNSNRSREGKGVNRGGRKGKKKKKYETNYPKHFSLQLSVLNPLDGGQAKFTPHANRYPPPPPPPPSNKGND